MSETPMTRHRKKVNAADVKATNLAAMERFWKDLEDHAQHLEDNSKRAKKLAETVKTITITQKVAGRTVPNKTRYEQVITRKSDKPFKTDAGADTKAGAK
jgi:3-methyladenine DNA glycosylase Tag